MSKEIFIKCFNDGELYDLIINKYQKYLKEKRDIIDKSNELINLEAYKSSNQSYFSVMLKEYFSSEKYNSSKIAISNFTGFNWEFALETLFNNDKLKLEDDFEKYIYKHNEHLLNKE